MIDTVQQLKLLLLTKRITTMNLWKSFIFSVCFTSLFYSFYTHGNLLISPTRIAFDERQRVAQVVVINNSKEYKTYRLAWEEKIAKPEGGYTRLEEGIAHPTALSNMVRMSPSQVRLAPGERQIVKLVLRRPQNLAEQEYRSHLLFQALPNENKKATQAIGIKIDLILSYSIPVLLRQGSKLPEVDIKSIALSNDQGKKSLHVSMQRKGEYSTFGNIEAFYKANNSDKEVKVAMVGSLSIYPEVLQQELTLNFFENNAITGPGKLRIVYTGLKEYRNTIFAEKTVSINTNSVGLLN